MKEALKFINEAISKDESNYSYSSVQVEAPQEIAVDVLRLVLSIPDDQLYIDPNDPTFGRELHTHITIKYGFTQPDPKAVEDKVKGWGPIKIKMGKVSLFAGAEGDKPYDVVKIDIESPDLMKMNAELSKIDNKDKHPEYHPHMTIAYVKAGQGAQYAGNSSLEGKEFTADRVVYKGVNGKDEEMSLL